jgi:hypothetical protein
MLKDILEIQPERETAGQPASQKRGRWSRVEGNSMLRRLMRAGNGVLPYLVWLVPLVDRVLPRKQGLHPGLKNLGNLSEDLRNDLRADLERHMAAIQAAQVDVTPALEEQTKRLEKLEEHAAELNHSLTNLSEDQLDLADQVRTMAGWVRNASIAGLFLLALLFILKLVQAIHGWGH